MNCDKNNSGFALFTVTLLVAVISLISLAMVNAYLVNTRTTSLDVQRIKADQLLDSGVSFAALSLASPRVKVSDSAIPSKYLNYAASDLEVVIQIENEAGFIDLVTADQELLKSALLISGASQSDVSELAKSFKKFESLQPPLTYRALREFLAGKSVQAEDLLSVATLHNGQTGVNPALAPEKVLALVPRLSKTERSQMLAKRGDKSPSLVSNPVHNEYFSSKVSAYYRISVSVRLRDQLYSRVQIIKMLNQRGRLYEVHATL